jgi:hypothetical protein
MISSQRPRRDLVKVGIKNERPTMEITNRASVQETLTIQQFAFALGLHEFSLFARIQNGDINPIRLRSGIMAISIAELERLSKHSIHPLAIPPDQPRPVLSDARLGIQREPGGLKQNGESQEFSVPGDFRRFTESEIKSYRAAFSSIASEFESLGELKKQLEKSVAVIPSRVNQIGISQSEVLQVRSTLLNLGSSDILLCQRANEFAVIEKFHHEVPYAQANGDAEILLQGNDARELMGDFIANAKHTLAFMASNQVATAQKVIWEQFPDHRPARVVAAISERCRQAVTHEEIISETGKLNQTNGRGMTV